MKEFTIRIADEIVQIKAQYEKIYTYCKDYLCDGTPAFTVVSTPEDIQYERKKSEKEDLRMGIPTRSFPEPYLEGLAVYRKIVQNLLSFDTLLIHGSAIAVDGEAFLFSATSGTGKSTHTAFWRQRFGDRAVMVNDDKPLIRIREDSVSIYGTPWDGKHRLSSNISVPLKAFCILERGEENRIAPISPAEALPMLMQQSSRPSNPAQMGTYLQLLDRLSQKIAFYRLSCTPDPEAAIVAYEGMTGKRP